MTDNESSLPNIPGITPGMLGSVEGYFCFKQVTVQYARTQGLTVNSQFGMMEVIYGQAKLTAMDANYETLNTGVLAQNATALQREKAKLWNTTTVVLRLAFDIAMAKGQFRIFSRPELDNALVGTVAQFWTHLETLFASHPQLIPYLTERATRSFDPEADSIASHLSMIEFANTTLRQHNSPISDLAQIANLKAAMAHVQPLRERLAAFESIARTPAQRTLVEYIKTLEMYDQDNPYQYPSSPTPAWSAAAVKEAGKEHDPAKRADKRIIFSSKDVANYSHDEKKQLQSLFIALARQEFTKTERNKSFCRYHFWSSTHSDEECKLCKGK